VGGDLFKVGHVERRPGSEWRKMQWLRGKLVNL
jgi:hypothetical protein